MARTANSLASWTLRDHVRFASALSALKKSLVANLSAKRQLSVAKLSAKRIFSFAERDFLVANGRMAADFSSPANGFWELVPVARHYIANSFDLHRPMGLHSTTDREISRFWSEKGFAMLPSGYRCDIDCSLRDWRASDKITCVDISTRFPKQLSCLTLATI